MIRFFIDECLSARLAAVAKAAGLQADFGPHLGMAGWQDWNIAKFAFENGYVVVTNNRRHFLREYLKYEIHNGLVIIIPKLERDQQVALFQRAVDYLLAASDLPVNQLVELLEDGSVHVRDWSQRDHDLEHIARPSWSR